MKRITHIQDIMAEEKKEEEDAGARFAVKITDMDEKLMSRVIAVLLSSSRSR